MAFDIMKLFEDSSFISPGSLGGKIKRLREYRGLTQKELGLRCGFTSSSADVRIAQYEKNKKVPREKALNDLTDGLDINDCALFDADLLPYARMFQALFDIEDFHGLHPVKIADEYYLEFSGGTIIGQNVTRWDYQGFLEKWYEMRQKYQPDPDDSPKEKARKEKEYALWRREYPKNVTQESTEQQRDEMEMRRLQAEMDTLQAKMKSKSELARIDKAIESVLSAERGSYTPIRCESDFIFILRDAIAGGLDIEGTSPEKSSLINYDYRHLFSIRTEDILSDEEKKRMFARLLCGIETMQQAGINIVRRITSRNNELFLTYEYPADQYIYFENLEKYWRDMLELIDKRDSLPSEVERLEKKFENEITGKNDVILNYSPIYGEDG